MIAWRPGSLITVSIATCAATRRASMLAPLLVAIRRGVAAAGCALVSAACVLGTGDCVALVMSWVMISVSSRVIGGSCTVAAWGWVVAAASCGVVPLWCIMFLCQVACWVG